MIVKVCSTGSLRWFIGRTMAFAAIAIPVLWVMAPDTTLMHYLACLAFGGTIGIISEMILYPEARQWGERSE